MKNEREDLLSVVFAAPSPEFIDRIEEPALVEAICMALGAGDGALILIEKYEKKFPHNDLLKRIKQHLGWTGND